MRSEINAYKVPYKHAGRMASVHPVLTNVSLGLQLYKVRIRGQLCIYRKAQDGIAFLSKCIA